MRQISRLLRRPYSPASYTEIHKTDSHPTDPPPKRSAKYAPSARHQDEQTRTDDGGLYNCKVIVTTIMGHGCDQHGASLH